MTTPTPDPTRARYSLADQIEEAKRELRYRYGVYAKRVADGRMTQEQADRQIALARNIRDTLQTLFRHYISVRAAIEADLREVREMAVRQQIEQHPAVGAVLGAFPGAEIGPFEPEPAPPDPDPDPDLFNPDEEHEAA
jgi:hypothetical protein